MKLLLLLILVIPILLSAQTKHDNTIVIPSQGLTEEKITQILVSNGYGIANSNRTYYQTTPKTKEYGMTVKLTLLLTDSLCLIKGDIDPNYTLMGQKSWYKPIEYGKGGYIKTGWAEMLKVAASFSGKLTFKNQ